MPTSFNLNTLKGRMAEHLVQDLFIQNDYNVFNFGLERLHPVLSKNVRTKETKTSKALRFMPDFVVQSKKNGDLFYLEVKFRANGFFEFDETYMEYPYHNAWFVIVSPEKIQCMHYKLLMKKNKITSHTNLSLASVKQFHIDKNILEEYEQYAQVMFQPFKK